LHEDRCLELSDEATGHPGTQKRCPWSGRSVTAWAAVTLLLSSDADKKLSLTNRAAGASRAVSSQVNLKIVPQENLLE
jgi:hypothetical protein